MSKKQKSHLYEITDIARSVLRGDSVISACGVIDQLTRERVDAPPAKVCQDCLRAEADANDGAVHYRAEGWVKTLERAFLVATSTQVTVSSSGVARWTFPLAG